MSARRPRASSPRSRHLPPCACHLSALFPSPSVFPRRWACVGACDPGEINAAVPIITQAVVRPAVFSEGGAVSLELLVLWFYLIEVITHTNPISLAVGACDAIGRALETLLDLSAERGLGLALVLTLSLPREASSLALPCVRRLLMCDSRCRAQRSTVTGGARG